MRCPRTGLVSLRSGGDGQRKQVYAVCASANCYAPGHYEPGARSLQPASRNAPGKRGTDAGKHRKWSAERRAPHKKGAPRLSGRERFVGAPSRRSTPSFIWGATPPSPLFSEGRELRQRRARAAKNRAGGAMLLSWPGKRREAPSSRLKSRPSRSGAHCPPKRDARHKAGHDEENLGCLKIECAFFTSPRARGEVGCEASG